MNHVRRALCKHCGGECKTNRAIYCSKECYTDSGRRVSAGRENGKIWATKFWDKFANTFDRKYGHLPRRDQVKMLIRIGQKRAYFKNYREKQNERTGS